MVDAATGQKIWLHDRRAHRNVPDDVDKPPSEGGGAVHTTAMARPSVPPVDAKADGRLGDRQIELTQDVPARLVSVRVVPRRQDLPAADAKAHVLGVDPTG